MNNKKMMRKIFASLRDACATIGISMMLCTTASLTYNGLTTFSIISFIVTLLLGITTIFANFKVKLINYEIRKEKKKMFMRPILNQER